MLYFSASFFSSEKRFFHCLLFVLFRSCCFFVCFVLFCLLCSNACLLALIPIFVVAGFVSPCAQSTSQRGLVCKSAVFIPRLVNPTGFVGKTWVYTRYGLHQVPGMQQGNRCFFTTTAILPRYYIYYLEILYYDVEYFMPKHVLDCRIQPRYY